MTRRIAIFSVAAILVIAGAIGLRAYVAPEPDLPRDELISMARDLLDEIDARLELSPAGDESGVIARLRVPALA